jgi:glycosyltransferase involved in cell wall biosynthesis
VRVVAFCSDPAPKGHPFDVVSISRGRLAVRYLKAFWLVWKYAWQADVVYVNEHLALLHVLAARLAFRPVMIRMMVDGAWEISHRKGWIDGDDINVFETKEYGSKVKLVRALQRFWWGRCSRIIACSNFLRDIAVGRYGQAGDKVLHVNNAYHGPTAEQFRQTKTEARAELGLAPRPRYALTICRLMGWKGVDHIVTSLKSLPPDVELLVAGDGDMLEPWKAHAKQLGLENRVHFLGNVPYSKIPLYIRAADVFVLNSEYEGLSHTLLEVSALGTPIVATGVCGNPEVVEHEVNGLLVPPKSPAELAKAIGRLLDDPTLAERFAKRGLERMDRFSRTTTFSKVEQSLAEVAGVQLRASSAPNA